MFLGKLLIAHVQRDEISLSNGKVMMLFAYLAVESSRPHSRETQLGLL